ncbi:hypothetical protein LTR62_005055 [Meristemomyces frigidus]|uniref:Uncharacterized protein n=1 Tax=Meristemomyces frigidus TaxID=1508187 RepID=A0AAN7YMZ6_9PEZI|nr:hypothetical protein LTR62_005055 [Meristemomyces frigidus]
MASLQYAYDYHIFELRSPSSVGAEADETLGNEIQRYIREELESAEKEEASIFCPFDLGWLSVFDSLMSETDGLDVPGAEGQPVNLTDLTPRATLAGQQPCLHLLRTQRSAPQLRLFKASELPHGLTKRILVHDGDLNAKNFIARGVTVRSARGGAQSYTSSIGKSLLAFSDIDQQAFLGMVVFKPLVGNSVFQEEEIEQPTQHWQSVLGREVGVDKWILGVGQTELVDPYECPEVPKEALRHLAKENMAVDRARVPKGAPILPPEIESDIEEEEEERPKMTFSQLLGAKDAGEFDSELSSSEPGSSSASDVTVPGRGKQTFKHMLSEAPANPTTSPCRAPKLSLAGPPAVSLAQSGAVQSSRAPILEPPSTSSAGGTLTHDRRSLDHTSGYELGSYGKDWAGVDKMGLKADAASLARWRSDQPEKRTASKKTLRLAPTARQTEASFGTSGSVSMSLSSGSMPGLSVHRVSAINDAQDWAKKVVPSDVLSGRLVDDHAAPRVKQIAPKYPPGLTPSQLPFPQVEENLIAFDNETVDQGRRGEHLPTFLGKPLLPQQVAKADVSTSNIPSDVGNDEICERLAASTPSNKQFTMRQKAQKKNKSKGKGENLHAQQTPAVGKAQLELPEPLPPPKQVSEKKREAVLGDLGNRGREAGSREPRLNHKARRELSSLSRETPRTDAGPSLITDPCVLLLEKMHRAALTLDTSARLEAKFGLVLVTLADQNIVPKSTASRIQLEDVNTEIFLDRLTTSTSDAMHLLGSTGSAPTQVLGYYEFLLRDHNGQGTWVKYAPDTSVNSVTERSADRLATAYVHYPEHVWDVQWTSNATPLTPQSTAVQAFVASLSAFGDVPCIRGRVPMEVFTVERALVKSEYSKLTPEGVNVLVTEVRELKLGSLPAVNAEQSNLKGICHATRGRMVAEHSLWWEAKVECSAGDDVKVLLEAAGRLMGVMDSVGYHNVGPWQGVEVRVAAPLEERPCW